MAQFLTFEGKVVAEQNGQDSYIKVRFRGRPEFVNIPAAEWKAKKRFEYFDAKQVKREKALDMYEAAQRQVATNS